MIVQQPRPPLAPGKKLPKPPKVHFGRENGLRTQCGLPVNSDKDNPSKPWASLITDSWRYVDCAACIRSVHARHDK